MFLGDIVQLLKRHNAKIIGRVWVNETNNRLKANETYGYAIQDIGRDFEHYLKSTSNLGLIVCDSRLPNQDIAVSHSIFTQKHSVAGDGYPSLVDAAVFGRSDNHVGIQLADLVASGLVFPMAVAAYTPGYLETLDRGDRFAKIRSTHGPTLKSLRYVYGDGTRTRGGIVVSDPIGKQPSKLLFG